MVYVLGYVAEEFEKTVLYFQTKINKWDQPPPYNTILTGTAFSLGYMYKFPPHWAINIFIAQQVEVLEN